MLEIDVVSAHKDHRLLQNESVSVFMALGIMACYLFEESVHKPNDRLQVVLGDFELTVEPIELQNEHEIEPKHAPFGDEVHVLFIGTAVSVLQYFLDDLHLSRELVGFFEGGLFRLDDFLDSLLHFSVFLNNCAITECSMMTSKVLSLITFSVISK